MRYLEHTEDTRSDKEGNLRLAIVFGLVNINSSNSVESYDDNCTADSVYELRSKLIVDQNASASASERVRQVYARSAVVAAYARQRAGGKCEACGEAAPFLTPKSLPFLEVHHIDRLADGGPDHPDRVAAVCPNCHRRCHYSVDAARYNAQLLESITHKEKLISEVNAS